MHWYQAFIVTDNGQEIYWSRFIAPGLEIAQVRMQTIFKEAYRKFSDRDRMVLRDRLTGIRVEEVPLSVLEKYDLNDEQDVGLLHVRAKG